MNLECAKQYSPQPLVAVDTAEDQEWSKQAVFQDTFSAVTDLLMEGTLKFPRHRRSPELIILKSLHQKEARISLC